MDIHGKRVTVFGGSGFLGKYVVQRLVDKGAIVNIITRNPIKCRDLKAGAAVGQVSTYVLASYSVKDIAKAIEGSDAVINLIGILFEKRKQKFKKLQTELPTNIAKAASKVGVKSFVHVSALGVDKSSKTSKYAKTKLAGEQAIKKYYPQATILRPSVIFGEEDNFYNQFAKMAKFTIAMPLIGGGKTLFQPVHVGDVAEAVIVAITNSAAQGNIYELGGPQQQNFEDIIKYILETANKNRALVSLPFAIGKLIGWGSKLLPKPFITPDQVELLKYNNVVSNSALKFADLGIKPKYINDIVPNYI